METITAAEARRLLARPKRNKYRAIPSTIDGHRFASRAEAARYGHLLMEQRAGLIRNLEVHPRWELYGPRQEHLGWYTGDFGYDRDGAHVVEDVKSPVTAKRADYQLRKRLMRQCYGIEIVEVMG